MNYHSRVKISVVMLVLLLACGLAPAQTNDAPIDAPIDVNGLLNAAQQFAQENLDDEVLRALQNVDRDKVEDFLKHYQDYLSGDYVLDMAQLKDMSTAVLPLLDAHEETQPYAVWLRSRLDYFDVAEQLKSAAPAPKPQTNAVPLPNPPFSVEEEIWVKKVAPRLWPKGAAEFVPRLKTIFAAERVPEELVWLAEVESGFDVRTRSPAGAVGLFQLMPVTAKNFGLSLWPRDQRKIAEVAAMAAAKYLRQLHAQFGDWRLAVAAYNCGEGRVQKTLKQLQAKTYAAIATKLPAETQMYVPKVAATILKREGKRLENLPVPGAK